MIAPGCASKNGRESRRGAEDHLCLGRVHQHPESNESWKDRIGWITTDPSYRDYDGISGEPTKFEWNIFPGFDTLQLYGKVKDQLSNLGETPEIFHRKNSCYVDVQQHFLWNERQ